MQMPLISVPAEEPGIGESSERVRDRRTLGADQPPQELMGEGKGEVNAARLDLAPTRGEVPHEENEPDLEPWLRGYRPLHVQASGPLTRAPKQSRGDLRPALHPLGEGGIQKRKARAHQHAPAHLAHELRILGRPRLHQIPCAEELGGDPVADLHVGGQDPIEQQQPGARAGADEPLTQPDGPGLGLEGQRGNSGSRGQAQRYVELLGELDIEVQQVLVPTREQAPSLRRRDRRLKPRFVSPRVAGVIQVTSR